MIFSRQLDNESGLSVYFEISGYQNIKTIIIALLFRLSPGSYPNANRKIQNASLPVVSFSTTGKFFSMNTALLQMDEIRIHYRILFSWHIKSEKLKT